jgi:hypothetical protein
VAAESAGEEGVEDQLRGCLYQAVNQWVCVLRKRCNMIGNAYGNIHGRRSFGSRKYLMNGMGRDASEYTGYVGCWVTRNCESERASCILVLGE